MNFAIGQTVYIGTERAYYGRATVETVEDDGNLIVSLSGKRGRVAPDQAFSTAGDAKKNARQTIFSR